MLNGVGVQAWLTVGRIVGSIEWLLAVFVGRLVFRSLFLVSRWVDVRGGLRNAEDCLCM